MMVIWRGGRIDILCYWSMARFLFSFALMPLIRIESFSPSYWNDLIYKVALKVLFSIFVIPVPSFLTLRVQVPVM